MTSIADLVIRMRANQSGIRYADLKKVCEHYFGASRQNSGSHAVFKMPWPGDPRVNIQNDRGKAKVYQVRQALAAIERLESDQQAGEGAS